MVQKMVKKMVQKVVQSIFSLCPKKVSTCKANMVARDDRTIVIWKGVLKTV